MSLYVIADTHLSLGTNKPMDEFDGWFNYVERLKNNWNRLVTDNDVVVIAGDISWAVNFEELLPDFQFIENLNGKKIIVKGNHDFWWNTMSKMNKFLEENNFKTIRFLYNNSIEYEGVSICGSRGWIFESEDDFDEKILRRESLRIRRSLDEATTENKILFLHYPPVMTNAQCREVIDIMHEFNVKRCYYGHLHGDAINYSREGEIEGINFKLISADRLNFTPCLVHAD